MAFWCVRAGKHGENESYALAHDVVTIGWENLGDLSGVKSKDELSVLMKKTYKHVSESTLRIWLAEVWKLRETIKNGDIVALPLKARSAVAFGRINGPYRFDPNGPYDGKHQRPVKWIRTDVPRAEIEEDILFSLGSTLAVFQVQRNDAESRIEALLTSKKKAPKTPPGDDETVHDPALDIEEHARDRLVTFIAHRYHGHDLARLVGGVLQAQGYKVHVSTAGPDGGVDILAGTGPMGFEPPCLAVQVKSGRSPVDVGVLRELQGVMPGFGAQQGLLVSWGGFKESVYREARKLFFQIRLWDAGDRVDALQDVYEKLSPDLQAEIPLKRIWLLVQDRDE
jgi:restriction system protein